MPVKCHTVTYSLELHAKLTSAEREQIQDYLARRYLQLSNRIHGRRKSDKPFPPSMTTESKRLWYVKRQLG